MTGVSLQSAASPSQGRSSVPVQSRLYPGLLLLGAVLLSTILLAGCGQSKEQALQNLQRLNLQFTPHDFVQSATRGDLKAVQLFLDAGMDPDSQDSTGSTALMAAAKNGRNDVVDRLLAQKLNLNLQDKQGESALMLAALGNQPSIVQQLLKRGADPNIQDQNGWSALMKAVYQGSPNCVIALVGQSRQEVNRALLVAALTGHKEIVKILLDHGAEVDTRADDGRTPLMLAASKGDEELVAALLAAGADPTLIDKSGATARTLAIAKGQNEMGNRLQNAPPPAQAARSASTPASPPPTGSVAASSAANRTSAAVSDKDFLEQPESGKAAQPAAETSEPASAPDSPKTAGESMSVAEIHEEFLPLMLAEVNGKKAKIQSVGGEVYNVSVGEQLKGLDYIVAQVEVRHTEDKDGNPVDDSMVKLRNTKSGHDVDLIRGVPAQDRPPYAILRLPGSDQPLKVEAEQMFSIPGDTGHTYKVLDIRPAQVIIRRIEDDHVLTLQKSNPD